MSFPISYEEYLTTTGLRDCRLSWIDWKIQLGMSVEEATRASYDPEWGYEN